MQTTSKKHVFFIIAYWHDPRFKNKQGGLIRIFDLADNLKRLGHDAILYLPKIGFPKEQTNAKVVEIPFIDLPVIRPLSFHLLSALLLLFQSPFRASVLYIRQMNSFLPFLIGKLFRIHTVFEVPNDPFLAYLSSGIIKGFLIRFIDNCCMTMADRIVVLSEWSKKRLNSQAKIQTEKITALPSGTDTQSFKPLDRAVCCNRVGLDPAPRYVGFLGSFFDNQGVDTLIDAAPTVLDQLENTRFLLIGDGPMMKAWKNKVCQQGLQQFFVFTGQVPYKTVPFYLGATDLCLAPHRKDTNQSSPVKLFDYMACSRPIIASDIEVVREVVTKSGCTLMIPPEEPDKLAQAIIHLMNNEDHRIEMGRKGRQYAVRYYDRIRIWDKLIQVLASGN